MKKISYYLLILSLTGCCLSEFKKHEKLILVNEPIAPDAKVVDIAKKGSEEIAIFGFEKKLVGYDAYGLTKYNEINIYIYAMPIEKKKNISWFISNNTNSLPPSTYTKRTTFL